MSIPSERQKWVMATVHAVSDGVQLVRADSCDAQQYLLNEAVMGPLFHSVQPGDRLQILVSMAPDQPHRILQVRRV